MSQLKLNHLLVLTWAALMSIWLCKPVDSFWFTDTNFQPGQTKVLPMIKSATEKPNMSLESSLANLQLRQPQPEPTPSSPPVTSDNIKCSCSSEWFERQLDLNIRKQFTEYFVKIANEELKKEVRAKNLSQDLFGPFKDLIPVFDRLLLLNRIQSDATILGGVGRVPLQRPNNEVEEIWINFRPPDSANVQQQLQPTKSHHAPLGVKSFPEEPGIIRVKDREALFDMKSRIQDRLVLVESEQLLVVDTGLGWRPLQMQPALRDFRRGLAKYGLRSNEQRQRLLESSVSKKPPSVDYLAKARESDATLSNYYHDRSSTLNEADGGREEDQNGDSDDDLDEDEEEDEDEGEDYSDDYFTGYSLLSSAIKRSKTSLEQPTTIRSIVSSTIAPEPLRHSSSVIGGRQTTGKSVSGSPPAVSSQSLIRDNQLSNGGSRQLRMAALNEPFTGSIHGLRGADFECSKAARKASIKGSFKAFLASGYQNLNELLRHNVRNLPIVNLRNEELASSWNDLFSKPSKLLNPLSRIYSFDGRLVVADSNWPNKLIWHGASSSSGQRHHLHQCDGWHSNSKTKLGMATPLHTPKALLGTAAAPKRKLAHNRFSFVGLFNHLNNQTISKHSARFAALDGLDKYPCSMPLIVLCIETVGQARDSSLSNYLDNYFDMDPRNMS